MSVPLRISDPEIVEDQLSGHTANARDSFPGQVLQWGEGVRATVRRLPDRQGNLVLKDFSHCRSLFRYTCGAFVTRREARAYARLAGVPGVPRCHGRPTFDALLLDFVDGANCRDPKNPTRVSESFFTELRQVLAGVRAAGVLHLDIKRNVLVTRDGRPFLIDFAASVVLPWWLRPVRRWLLRVAALYDERDVARLKALMAPTLMTRADADLAALRLPFEPWVEGAQTVVQGLVRWVTGNPRG